METFWYRLTQIHLVNGHLNGEREKGRKNAQYKNDTNKYTIVAVSKLLFCNRIVAIFGGCHTLVLYKTYKVYRYYYTHTKNHFSVPMIMR